MTNEEFDRRITALTTRQEELTSSLGLLETLVGDLTADVQAMVDDGHERAVRDRHYLAALSELLKSWGNGEDE